MAAAHFLCMSINSFNHVYAVNSYSMNSYQEIIGLGCSPLILKIMLWRPLDKSDSLSRPVRMFQFEKKRFRICFLSWFLNKHSHSSCPSSTLKIGEQKRERIEICHMSHDRNRAVIATKHFYSCMILLREKFSATLDLDWTFSSIAWSGKDFFKMEPLILKV